jgi:DNA-binding PadR family transcriptional regulator
MLEGVLLLLLVEEPRYGYELWSLIEEEELLAGRVYVGRIYEMLRRLLESGFVAASPEESTKGPPRSRYEVTPLGRERLERWRVGLQNSHDRVGHLGQPQRPRLFPGWDLPHKWRMPPEVTENWLTASSGWKRWR